MLSMADGEIEQLIYVSSASHLMTDQELIEILNTARAKNEGLDISGMLVYSDGTFIQVLEGTPSTVEHLFRHIEMDARHRNCFQLLRQRVVARAFEGWSMGFRALSPDDVANVIGYIDFFGDRPVPERGAAAYSLLTSFRKQHDRELDFSLR